MKQLKYPKEQIVRRAKLFQTRLNRIITVTTLTSICVENVEIIWMKIKLNLERGITIYIYLL